jgi:hypothetical protein
VATVHTQLPKDASGHHGEYLVGQLLSGFSNPGLELWFDVNYIAGVTDLDLILLDDQVGYYLIEIKSMKIEAIEEFTSSIFIIKPTVQKQHPVTQLRTGSLKLRDYLKQLPKFKDKGNLPFIQSTVLWSEITRSDWKKRFTEPTIAGFEGMCLYKDDLDSYNKLVSALQRVWDKPILGVTVPNHARHEHGDSQEFRRALLPGKHKIQLSTSMAEEIKRPAKESKKIAEKYPPGKQYLVSLQGAPGTGKTTILREVGLTNLAAGARVLYVCFNKVLAADQKREFQILRKQVDEYGFIDVFDVWELYKVLGHHGGISKESEILHNVSDYLESEEGRNYIKYDVLLIDESQDLNESFFLILEKISRPNASWFIAYGKGQETNNFRKDEVHPSKWLATFLEKATPEYRRRSFRNSPKAFLIAQSLWEKYPDVEGAKEWLSKKFSQQSQEELQFELDLQMPQTRNDFKLEILPPGILKKSATRNLILNVIADARQANRGEDLLVGVIKPPTYKLTDDLDPVLSSYELVKDVLIEITSEFRLTFHDLIPNENRREIPEIGSVRLVSLQNIRGLSASHVVIFDLFQLEKWIAIDGASIKPPIANLGYIALSRSKASTIVVLENAEHSKIEPFLIEVLSHSTELALRK